MHTQTSTCTVGNNTDHEYDHFLARLQERFLARCQNGSQPLFTTDAEDLWGLYLGSFSDPVERQYHNCHACRHFIQRFGSLATLDEGGKVASALWQEEDGPAFAAMNKAVRRAKVTGVFLSSDTVWGTPETGVWHHLAVKPPKTAVFMFRSTTLTAGQQMAEKREDFKTVMTALNEFTQPCIETALTLLRTDSLYRSLWRPQAAKDEVRGGGVFGHLKPKGKGVESPSLRIPAQTMTWEKFQRTVLPTAERIEFLAPAWGNYAALVTAVNADAPPILQWDREEERNPVSWYLWIGGASAESFSLAAGHFHEVEAVTLQPSMWHGGYEHQGAGVMFIIRGARETRNPSAALFPEMLRQELHGIRSVIEAYSKQSKLEGMEQPHAAGYLAQTKASEWNVTLRVWSGGRSLDYRLDRWD